MVLRGNQDAAHAVTDWGVSSSPMPLDLQRDRSGRLSEVGKAGGPAEQAIALGRRVAV